MTTRRMADRRHAAGVDRLRRVVRQCIEMINRCRDVFERRRVPPARPDASTASPWSSNEGIKGFIKSRKNPSRQNPPWIRGHDADRSPTPASTISA